MTSKELDLELKPGLLLLERPYKSSPAGRWRKPIVIKTKLPWVIPKSLWPGDALSSAANGSLHSLNSSLCIMASIFSRSSFLVFAV
jgi:hypothetical protein